MPRPQLRSRSLKRRSGKRPLLERPLHLKRKKVSRARCGRCGSFLSGVPNLPGHRISLLAKSKRRPSRIYGGSFCPGCVRQMILDVARKTSK
jgi:large subunit ribosomal protein L34e